MSTLLRATIWDTDRKVARLVESLIDEGAFVVVTADHGNCEDMGAEEDPNTSHTLNKVPLIGVNTEESFEDGELWEIENIVEDFLGL